MPFFVLYSFYMILISLENLIDSFPKMLLIRAHPAATCHGMSGVCGGRDRAAATLALFPDSSLKNTDFLLSGTLLQSCAGWL